MKQKLRQWLIRTWIDVKNWLTKEVDIAGYLYAMSIVAAIALFLVMISVFIDYWTIEEPHDEVATIVATMLTSDIPAAPLTDTPLAIQATSTPLPTFEVPVSSTPTNTYLPSPTSQVYNVVQTKVVEEPTEEPSPAPTWDWSTPWPTSPPDGTPYIPPPTQPGPYYTYGPTVTPADPPTKVPTDIPSTAVPTISSYPNP